MSETTHKTTLQIGGTLDNSLKRSADGASKLLGSIEQTGSKVGKTFSGVFGGMGRGMDSLIERAASVAVGLGSIALAAVGLKSLHDVIDGAVERFSKLEDAEITLSAALNNNPLMRKQGSSGLEANLKAIEATADKMEGLSSISKEAFEEGFGKLAEYGAGANEIDKIKTAFADTLIATKGLNATGADSVDLAKRIGASVNSGVLRWRELGLTKEQIKRFKEAGTAQERLNILAVAMEKIYGGQAEARRNSIEGQTDPAHRQIDRFFTPVGGSIAELQEDWTKFVAKLMPIFSPERDKIISGFHTIGESINEAANDPRTAIEIQKTVDHIGDIFNTIENGWSNLGHAIGDDPGVDPKANWIVQILQAIETNLGSDADTIKWVGDIFNGVGASVAATCQKVLDTFNAIGTALQSIAPKLAPATNGRDAGWSSYQQTHPGATRQDYDRAVQEHWNKRGGGGPAPTTQDGLPIASGARLTQFGPSIDHPGDANYDTNSAMGNGDRENMMERGLSAALSPDVRQSLFPGVAARPSTGRFFVGPDGKTYRDDDTPADYITNDVDVFMAKGGIVNRPTRALIGEAGPEAVVPLRNGGIGTTVNVHVGGITVNTAQGQDIEQISADKIVRLIQRGIAEHERTSFA